MILYSSVHGTCWQDYKHFSNVFCCRYIEPNHLCYPCVLSKILMTNGSDANARCFIHCFSIQMNQSLISSLNALASSWIELFWPVAKTSLPPPHPPFPMEGRERAVNAGFILGLEPGCAREHPVHRLAFYSFIAYFTVKPGAANLSWGWHIAWFKDSLGGRPQ